MYKRQIIAGSEATFVTLGNFSTPSVLLAIFGILLTIAFVVKKVPAAVFAVSYTHLDVYKRQSHS